MWKYLLLLSIVTKLIVSEDLKQNWSFIGNPIFVRRPCEDNVPVSFSYEPGRPPEDENNYDLQINEELPQYSRVEIKFDSPATLTLSDRSSARIEVLRDKFLIVSFKPVQGLDIRVQGPSTGTVPYITSLLVNNVQYCKKPNVGILDKYIKGYRDSAQISLTVPDDTCGRRKVTHTELITNGVETKPGDWPWHVALNKLEYQSVRYICGGTLISKTFVLTAAHCVTNVDEALIPEVLSVELGKYNLIGGDIGFQEVEVHQVIVHEDFDRNRLDNDIALLKLKSEVQFTDYIQPACLWSATDTKKLPSEEVYGTVTGWGFDQTDKLSTKLRQAVMPIVSEIACIKSNPLFFSRLLNDKKYCAGFRNGTAACNGDSGGGYVVFVPDTPGASPENASGTWHVRGITSLAVARRNVALCDPKEYVIFTDVEKYSTWLSSKMQ